MPFLMKIPCGEAILIGETTIQVASVATEPTSAAVVPWLAAAAGTEADPSGACHTQAAADRVVVAVTDGAAGRQVARLNRPYAAAT